MLTLSCLQVLSEQIISNESRIAKTKVIMNFNKPRQMQFTFLVRYEDFDKVEAICSDMKDHLLNTEGIHRQLPMWVGFTGVEGNACNVYTIVSPLPHCLSNSAVLCWAVLGCAVLCWAGLCYARRSCAACAVLDWAVLSCDAWAGCAARLGCAMLGWAILDHVLGCAALCWAMLGCMCWAGLCWTGLCWGGLC